MLAIKNNVMAGNAARQLSNAYDNLATSVERLSSGLRINSAKDDAAGLAVRELIRADVAVLDQGARNAQDGISMLQTMEGAMGVIDDNLIRMKELAEQAATGSYSEAQRQIMDAEFGEMADEIDRIAETTEFNDITMLNGDEGEVSIHVGSDNTIDVEKVDMTKEGLGINTDTQVYDVDLGGTIADSTDTSFLEVSDATTTLTFAFANGTEAEETISVSLTVGSYSMADVASAINTVSGALADASDGTEQAYDAAEVVQGTDGNYSLQVSSRDTSDTVTINASSTSAGGDLVFSDTNASVTGLTTSATALATNAYSGAQAAGGVNIASVTAATAALDTVDSAIEEKDTARAAFGYKMNRLESTTSIVEIQSENLTTAESRISDVDVATEMATLTSTQVLAQSGISMLAQANQMPQMALSLLA